MRISGFLSGGSGSMFVGSLAVLAVVLGSPGMGLSQQGGPAAIDANANPPQLFADFLHYAKLGRFTLAEKYADALLNHPTVDPVELLEVADSQPDSIETLTIIIRHGQIGPKAAQVLELLRQGEQKTRKQPERIRENIRKLGGTPQQKWVAQQNLAESGEFAVPALVAVLLDNQRRELHLPVRDALVAIGKPAVTPLSIALDVEDFATRLAIIEALGELGYGHAVPYLRRLTVDGSMPQEIRSAATAAIDKIAEIRGRPTPGRPNELFFALAEAYFNEDAVVRADPRPEEANVWSWDTDSQTLVATVVPTKIFGPVMAMQCAKHSIALRHDNGDAISLWLASNIRRESRLGLNVESGDPGRTGETDATQPDVFPRALYFTQAAGPRYAHMVLERAVKDGDSAVALGAIEALRITAGEASLIGPRGSKLPLAQALSFPDQVVRTRAALALGAALPRTTFSESQYVVPLLADALGLSGRSVVLVVDPDAANRNRIVDGIRTGDRTVVGESNFYTALARARAELPTLTGVFVATNVDSPGLSIGLAQMRSEVGFSKTPVVVMVKAEQSALAESAASSDMYVEAASSSLDGPGLLAALDRVRVRTGQTTLDGDLAREIALQSAHTLAAIARDGQTVFDVTQAEPALVAALNNGGESLQLAVGKVLGMTPTSTAQAALAEFGLDGGQSETIRIPMLNALARSARNAGNLLPGRLLNRLVDAAKDENDLAIRTAASQALGALNLETNKASEIIRSYYEK